MVHVMSEVKRFNPSVHLPGMFPHPIGNYVRFPSFNRMKQSRDAQRLRADTAEADALQFRESSAQIAADLIAAEQRIAELEARYGFLCKVTPYRFRKMQEAASTDGGDVIYFHADKFDAQVDAALNQKSEGESHVRISD